MNKMSDNKVYCNECIYYKNLQCTAPQNCDGSWLSRADRPQALPEKINENNHCA